MTRPSSGRSVRRRRVLAGLGALGATSVAAGVVSASGRRRRRENDAAVLEPAGSLALRGAAEAVVDDDGTTVYCSVNDGFAVVDASDPANPSVVSEERDLAHDGSDPMGSIMDVKVDGDRLLVSGPNGFGEGLSGFFLYDVSDPASPERVAFQPTEFGPHNSFLEGGYVYLTGSGVDGQPVVIFDVADGAPEEVARWTAADADPAWADVGGNYRSCHDMFVQDDALYVAYWDAGTWLVDVSDPANPTATAHLGGLAPEYLADLDGVSPQFFELPGNSHYVQPNADGSRVFVGKEAWDRPETDVDGGPGGIELWDVSAAHPGLATVLAPPQPGPSEEGSGWTSHNFGVDDDRLYTSWYGGGVRVYDVGDLAAPKLLGGWRDPERTSFWTAKPLASGFVATSYVNPGNTDAERRRGEGAQVFVFPEPDDSTAEPAPTMDRRPFPSESDGGTTGGTTSRTNGTTTSRTTSERTTATTTTASTTNATVVDDPSPVPGFGALSALAAGGLGLWRLLGDRDDADGDA